LKNEEVAQIIANSLHFWDGKKIDLMAFCIMSNHVHLVLRLLESENQEIFLSEVLESIKKFSARECNLVIGRTGQFWQSESFDRLVRDRKELYRIICYILDNPTKEGLCENRADWKWNYVKEEYNEFM
jgi:putative transposase